MVDSGQTPRHCSRRSSSYCIRVLVFVAALILFNEWLVYYVVLRQCRWPSLDRLAVDQTIPEYTTSHPPLRVAVMADLHVPNNKQVNAFSRARSDWQIQRSFQTAMQILRPEAVFVLGDMFDSGDRYTTIDFLVEAKRLLTMFQTPEDPQIYFLAGNHDIGRQSTTNVTKIRRFESAFKSPFVRFIRIRDVSFVLLNSIFLTDDECSSCEATEADLRKVSTQLNCAKRLPRKSKFCSKDNLFNYTKPILLQHFPMFRLSDRKCLGQDVSPPGSNAQYTENIDVLSKEKSDMLLKLIKPRLILDGHKHYTCETEYSGVPERTISPFTWRCRNSPSFALLTVSSNNWAISQCSLPRESTVVGLYASGSVFLLVISVMKLTKRRKTTV